jgi:L-asparagine oxygenase
MEVRRLPELSRRVWHSELAGFDFPSRENDAAAWSAFETLSVELAAKHLSPEITDALDSLPENRGILVLENLPQDTDGGAPPTKPPEDNFRPAGKPSISEAVHLGVIRRLAQVFGFREEEEGAIFHQIAPKAGREYTQSNGSVVRFEPHSDDAFLIRQHRPEFLSLYGIMNDQAASTWVFPVEDVMGRLSPSAIEQLQRPMFRHAPPQSFHTLDHEMTATLHPVLEQHDGRWEISFNSVRTSGVDAAAGAALQAVREALQQSAHEDVVVTPGTLMIFSNLRHLHGRGAISGRRWLQRLYSRRDLTDLRRDSGVAEPALVFPAARLVAGYASLVG